MAMSAPDLDATDEASHHCVTFGHPRIGPYAEEFEGLAAKVAGRPTPSPSVPARQDST